MLLSRVGLLLGFDQLTSQFQHLLQKLQTREETLLVSFLDLLQSLPECSELRVARVLPKAGDELDFDLLTLLFVVRLRMSKKPKTRTTKPRIRTVARRASDCRARPRLSSRILRR